MLKLSKNLKVLLCLVIGIVLSIPLVFFIMSKLPQKRYEFPNNAVIAAWEWRTLDEIITTHSNYSIYLQTLQKERINTLYLNINEYIDISEISSTRNKNSKTEFYSKELNKFIQNASSLGIKVHALAGDKTWVNDSHNYLVDVIIDFVKEYNDSSDQNNKFAGIQFDIEPYNQPDFEENKQKYFISYLNFIDKTQKRLNKEFNPNNFELSLALPFWLDENGEKSEKVEWDNIQKYPIFHILDILNKYSNSKAVIMDYRNMPYGTDGLITHINSEVEYIAQNKLNVKIIVGVETLDIKPEKITYFNSSKNTIRQHYNLIIDEFSNNIIIGISLHTANSFISLRDI